MEQVNVKLTPTNTSYPTITRVSTDSQLILEEIEHDTYTLEITSDAYRPYQTSVVIDGETELNIHLEAKIVQSVEWRSMSKITTIPITTKYTDDATLNVGVEVESNAGTQGKIVETWEEEFINGVSTSQKRNPITTTVDMLQRQVRRGTKVQLVDVLTQSNASATYSTNVYVNNVRPAGDVVPMGGTAFEIRQWDAPSGAITIRDGDLLPTTTYTLAMEMENIGTTIETAKFVIGLSFFGGKHFFNGVEVSIPPSAGEYNFKPHLPSSGKITYHFQFTTEPGTPAEDYFQANFDNASNNTIVRVSNLALYKGFVNPFGGV